MVEMLYRTWGQPTAHISSLTSRSPKISDFDSKFGFLINLRGLPHRLELFAGILTGFRVFLHALVIFSEGGHEKKIKNALWREKSVTEMCYRAWGKPRAHILH